MTLMTLGTPWWVRLLVRCGFFVEEPPKPALRAAAQQRPELHIGPAGTAVWLALAQLERTDRTRYFALHGALLQPVTWGQA